MNAMAVSVVRRLCAIARELDGIRIDSVSMNPRPSEDAIDRIYRAEAELYNAARSISPQITEHYRRRG